MSTFSDFMGDVDSLVEHLDDDSARDVIMAQSKLLCATVGSALLGAGALAAENDISLCAALGELCFTSKEVPREIFTFLDDVTHGMSMKVLGDTYPVQAATKLAHALDRSKGSSNG